MYSRTHAIEKQVIFLESFDSFLRGAVLTMFLKMLLVVSDDASQFGSKQLKNVDLQLEVELHKF